MKTTVFFILLLCLPMVGIYAQTGGDTTKVDTTRVDPPKKSYVLMHDGKVYQGIIVSRDGREILIKDDKIGEIYLSLSDIKEISETPVIPESEQKEVIITTNNNNQYIGKILSRNPREILIEDRTIGQIYVPVHEVKNIQDLKEGDISSVTGMYIPEEVFSTRYFLTTNGLPIKRGEHYATLNPLGPEVHFAAADNFGLGIMTTWWASPMILVGKASIPLDTGVSLAIGTLAGAELYGDMINNLRGVLPFASLTFGDRRANFTMSAGFASIRYSKWVDYYNQFTGSYDYTYERVKETRAMFSIAFMFKAGRTVSFVFDSMIVPGTSGSQNGFGIFMPGLRFQQTENKAIQIGMGGVAAGGDGSPLPMVQWFRRFN